MRFLRRVSLALIVVLLLTVTAFAQQNNLKVSNAVAEQGKMIYLTLELTQSTKGNIVSVEYDYDDRLLTFRRDSSSWVKSSMLSDFDSAHNTGVWSVKDETDLKGGVCVLAFQVNDKASFTRTEVSCRVRVKNGSTLVGEYTATGVVTMDCNHSYGSWKDAGNLGHTQTCTICDGQKTQSHVWDQGKETQTTDPGKVEKLYTCTVCGGTKTVTENKEQSVVPTFPKTEEDEAEQAPTQSSKPSGLLTPSIPQGDPTEPTKNPSATTPSETQKPSGNVATQPGNTVPEHDHDHDHENTANQNENDPTITGAVIAVVVVAMAVAAVLYVKKKRH